MIRFVLSLLLLAMSCQKAPEPCYMCLTTGVSYRSVGAPLNTPLPANARDSSTVCGTAARDQKLRASPSTVVLGDLTVVFSTTCRAQ